MDLHRLYTFTLTQDEAATLVEIGRKITNDSIRIGFAKHYTAAQLELIEQILEVLTNEQPTNETIQILADRRTFDATGSAD